MTHALLTHSLHQINKAALTSSGTSLETHMTGFSNTPVDLIAQLGTQLINLEFNRQNEIQANLVGQKIAALAAYHPIEKNEYLPRKC